MSESDEQTPKKPGKVKHDASGRAVWQWAAESGRHAIDSTSRLLKRLEVPGLKVEEYQPKANPRAAAGETRAATPAQQQGVPERVQPPDTVKGYDPYGGRNDSARGAAARPATKPAPKPAAAPGAPLRKPVAEPEPRRSLLGRLFRK
jgi:hypothetical protein